jgi:hypothetical protein
METIGDNWRRRYRRFQTTTRQFAMKQRGERAEAAEAEVDRKSR